MFIKANNSVVSIEYEVKEVGLDKIVDSNRGTGIPLEFITGKEHIIAGLENALIGMKKNETNEILVKAKDGYGEVIEEAIETFSREDFKDIELTEGLALYGQGINGEQIQVKVKSFTDTEVTIDYNHPLAGKDLIFNVTILNCREATKDEIISGQVGCIS